jgi:hypothetical protein
MTLANHTDLTQRITKKCTGVADRAESEINVVGRNPVILGVLPSNHAVT